MDEQMEANLQTIEDLVLIEDKIVTYKYLSSRLKVHANTAKQLLFAFSQSENNIENLNVTYVITGFLKESDEYHITLVNEKKLDEVRKSFKSVTSEHVYCIQKRTHSSNTRNVYISDSDWCIKGIDNRFSAISISKDNVRSTRSCNSLQAENETIKASETLKQDKSNDLRSKSNEINGNKIGKGEPLTELPPLKVQETNVEKKQTTPSPKKDKKTVKKNSAPKGAGISVFFNKQMSKPDVKSKNESKTETKKTQEKHPFEEAENIIVNNTPSPKKLRIEKEAQSKDPKQKNKNMKTKDKKKKRGESESKEEERKRKRIKVFSDSESSEEEESRMAEDPPPEEPPSVLNDDDDEVIPPTPVEKGKKRVRKEVDRTFVDEDDFLVTKKEYVYEESEDNSNEAVMTKDAEENKTSTERKKESPKAVTKPSPTKNKQASITNFFKRK